MGVSSSATTTDLPSVSTPATTRRRKERVGAAVSLRAVQGHMTSSVVTAVVAPPRSPLVRDLMDPLVARLRVEGGAPYLNEDGHSPMYPPDEYDSPRTHPLATKAPTSAFAISSVRAECRRMAQLTPSDSDSE